MIVDGRALAKAILARTKTRAEKLPRPPRVLALVADETPATKSYLAIKAKRAADAGCELKIRHIKESVRPSDIVDMSREADAVILQLPLSAEMDAKALCDVIPIGKDADVLSSSARAAFEMMDLRSPSLLPPVVGAVRAIFLKHGIEPKGRKVVVIGRGFLVGAPVAIWFRQQGAEVAVITREAGNFPEILKEADIIVSGAGAPHLIKPEMLKIGVVLIDAGTSESGGAIVGDADPACAAKCALFTPVPGGVGPIAVACLFENVTALTERQVRTALDELA
ncbi:bifunctional 5,10-methylenetetrahydrofolate dehydrogenase/5,10-methenyltetrahydrofolate cyclohydrolase [Candidatus Kaiserbacteria bacterium]|nr:bifunctional 5,10-methylenetetrahydrofolate dehydrogenase/5,10-methenyltetrahydrofolate cyclohydrolase [Candidatus Kaiserbacteria bacterium]